MPSAIAVAGLSLITVAAFGLAGDCCAACQSPATSGAVASACTDAGCENCAADAVVGSSTTAGIASDTALAAIAAPTLLTGLAPWLTPLGGLLLVSAHLLNRRYGCVHGCCGADSPTGNNA